MATRPRTDPNFIDSDTDSSRALAHTNTIAACLQNIEVYKGFGIRKYVACLNSHQTVALSKPNPLRIAGFVVWSVCWIGKCVAGCISCLY